MDRSTQHSRKAAYEFPDLTYVALGSGLLVSTDLRKNYPSHLKTPGSKVSMEGARRSADFVLTVNAIYYYLYGSAQL